MWETLRSVLRFRKLELDPTARRLARCANIDDLRAAARRRMPRGCFDYIDGAAEDETTQRRNCRVFDTLQFRPRVLADVGEVDTRTTLLGRELPFPLVLAPVGFTRVAHSQGELAVARAAERVGIPYSLSTLSTRSIEEVAGVSRGPKWFQVYVWRDRGLVKELVERAAAAGFEAMLLTVDTAVLGRRERDVRNGFTLPPALSLGTLVDGALHPGWTLDFLRADPIVFSNVVGRGQAATGADPISLAEYIGEQFDPTLHWRDVEWLRSIWDGPIVLKGIQRVEDAVRAAEAGVQAIALSNHGGRQLDGAPSTLELVGPVADRVGDRLEILCDGGVRRGSDIVKALSLGARACMAGRAYAYALGAGGERGVDLALGWLHDGMRRSMALAGVRNVAECRPDLVEWRRD